MNISGIENTLINTSFGLLILTLISYWWNLTINTKNNFTYFCHFLTLLINLAIALSLVIRWINNKYFPLSNLYESLLFLGWCITFVQIFIERKVENKFIGSITIPIVLFTVGFANMSLPPELKLASPLVPALKSNWLMMHVTVMILSYSTLMIGSLLSFLLLIISGNQTIRIEGNSINNEKKILLKYSASNDHSNVSNIKLMQFIDNMSYRTIGFGFPLLTIGIISGAVWANDAWGTYWSWDPKETWALITWITFAIYLHSRINSKLQGKKPAIIASIGFIVIWICYLGVNFLGKGLHSYGWLFT
uniref:Cytochrome c biogenesis protein CcsA n=1 Tax=Tolypiocladia glomerulata TaxID=860646 RepID=A0A1Z1MUB7_9FLOR|nr:cytochrome c biogenesis protein ccs1 [Tolypiocladia glomerulata]ARW69700.1 cytochrome c biogenesis protein ccs1 [Tolypiocladia glomerulata]